MTNTEEAPPKNMNALLRPTFNSTFCIAYICNHAKSQKNRVIIRAANWGFSFTFMTKLALQQSEVATKRPNCNFYSQIQFYLAQKLARFRLETETTIQRKKQPHSHVLRQH